MSDNGRRVFSMDAALGVVAGKSGADVLDLLGYVLNRAVCNDCRPAVTPIVKGWLCSLNPEFMKLEYNDSINYDGWTNEQKRKLGDNISITPMPERELAGINVLFESIDTAFKTAEDKTQEAEEAVAAKAAADAEIKVLTPFKKKAEDLEKKVAQLEEKNKALTEEAAEAKSKLSGFDGKVAIDENEIEKNVKEIISKAVKSSLGGLLAAGGAAGVAGAAMEGTSEEPAAAEEATGGVPDSFGFGTSGSDGDGFGF